MKKSKGERLGWQKESEVKPIKLNLVKRQKVEIEKDRNTAYNYLIR
ncbi:hypothetical protein [Sphingobacterium multivorum]